MATFIILIAVTLVGYFVMRSLADDSGRLPPASTPKGKRARVITGLVLIMLVSALVYSTVIDGSMPLTPQTSIVVAILVLIPLLVRWKMDGPRK
jgi:hypothetical protein